jgi:hypothetical protein
MAAATILATPRSTGNATRTRDPAMKRTHKRNQWRSRMKRDVGADTRGLAHSLTTTDATTLSESCVVV